MINQSRLFVTLVLLTATTSTYGQDTKRAPSPTENVSQTKVKWSQFRGAKGNNVSLASSAPLKWSDDSKNIAWNTPIDGLGWSSPVVKDGLVWLTTAVEKKSLRVIGFLMSRKARKFMTLRFFNQKLGRIHQKNSHASPTPILDEKHIFVHFGEYGTAAIDYDGKVIWKKAIQIRALSRPGGSPALVGDRMIIACDGSKEQFVIALNKNNGEEIWRTKRKHINPDRFSGAEMVPIAFSTPCVHKTKKGTQVIVPGADHTAAFDVETGKEIWWAPYDGFFGRANGDNIR